MAALFHRHHLQTKDLKNSQYIETQLFLPPLQPLLLALLSLLCFSCSFSHLLLHLPSLPFLPVPGTTFFSLLLSLHFSILFTNIELEELIFYILLHIHVVYFLFSEVLLGFRLYFINKRYG